METDKDPTIVIFRRWKPSATPWKSVSVIALFPLEDAYNGEVSSYEHIGQHGGADYNRVISMTTPANEDDPDVQALKKELTQNYGYKLIVRKRRPSRR